MKPDIPAIRKSHGQARYWKETGLMRSDGMGRLHALVARVLLQVPAVCV